MSTKSDLTNLITGFVLGLNSIADKRMGTELRKMDEEFTEVCEMTAEYAEDNIKISPGRLLALRWSMLYAKAFLGRPERSQISNANNNEIPISSSEEE